MASGIIVGDAKQFGWTVDAHVGPGCPNRPEDVQLVQFGYHCKIRNPKAASDNAAFTAQEKATIMSIVPGEPYAGLPSEKLTIAIRAHQRIRGGTQDGRVSPVGNASGFYGSETTWMVLALVTNIIDLHPQHWPALHRIPTCPPALAAASKRVCHV